MFETKATASIYFKFSAESFALYLYSVFELNRNLLICSLEWLTVTVIDFDYLWYKSYPALPI